MKKSKQTFTSFLDEDITLEEAEQFLKDDPVGKAIEEVELAIQNKYDELEENLPAAETEELRKPGDYPTTTGETSEAV